MAQRHAHLTDQDLEVLGRQVVGEGGFQTLLRRLKASIIGRELVVDEETFEMMNRYAGGYGEGGRQGRLREVIGGMTIVTPGVLNEGATASHPDRPRRVLEGQVPDGEGEPRAEAGPA